MAARRGRSMGSGRQTKRSRTANATGGRSASHKTTGGRNAAVGKGPLRGDNQGT